MFWKKKDADKAQEAKPDPEETQDVLKALKGLVDETQGKDIVSLNYVRNLRACDGIVAFDLVFTTPAHPKKNELLKKARDIAAKVEGVKEVNVSAKVEIESTMPENLPELLKGVKNIIAVSSGKGGVGKSTVAVNLALALAKTGARVGLMDADVYGPSVPKMLSGMEKPQGDEGVIYPIERYGVKFMSMALLTDKSTPVIWRGPMATKLIQHFLSQVAWGALDYLLIDLPPGTGDVQLTLTQSAPLTGAVIVTTPQEVAVDVTMRGIQMFHEVQVPILGIIENMSGFVCPHCQEETPIFTSGGGEKTAHDSGYKFLGKIPLDPVVTQGGDQGRPVVDFEGKDRPASAIAFEEAAKAVALEVANVNRQTASVKISPKKITNDQENLIIEWSDQTVTHHPFRALRLSCSCAECVDEWTHEPKLDPKKIPLDVKPRSFKTIGKYGLQITWSDGHSAGIFLFNKLRKEGKVATRALPVQGEGSKEATP